MVFLATSRSVIAPHYMPALTPPGPDPRIARMPDGAPRLASLSVIGGPLHGKRVDLAGVDEITIGSDPGCSLAVVVPGISTLPAKVWGGPAGAQCHGNR